MKLLFWGQFDRKEFAMPFCTAWERQIGEVNHFSHRLYTHEQGLNEGFAKGLKEIREYKPNVLLMWQGPEVDASMSRKIREACEEVGCKFFFMSLDDPFVLQNWNQKPYAHAHVAVSCCMEAREMYARQGVKEFILAPPACSIEIHMARSRLRTEIKQGVFYFFTNPYLREVYKKYGAINRFDTMRELMGMNIPVGFASVPAIHNHNYLMKSEWAKMEWQGFIPYDEFPKCNNWALHFNSSVVGRNFTYFNQRVFEIIGIGGVQTLDVSDENMRFFDFFLAEAGIKPEDSPIVYYRHIPNFIENVKAYLEDPTQQQRRMAAARRLRWTWTFDHLVRRIAFGEETVFDRFEKAQSSG